MLLRNNPTLYSFLRTHTCMHTGSSVCTKRVHIYHKITPRINTLVTEPEDLSSIPNIHMLEEINNICIYIYFPSVKGGKSLDAVLICFPSLSQILEWGKTAKKERLGNSPAEKTLALETWGVEFNAQHIHLKSRAYWRRTVIPAQWDLFHPPLNKI